MKKKILVAIGSRANYGSIRSVIAAIERSSTLELILCCFASAMVERFGRVRDVIIADGFHVDYEIENLIDSGELSAMAKSTGLALIDMANVIKLAKPDAVITIGDRFETLATAIATSYQNIPLLHTMGGEVSGTIDENIRHAITKLAHYHFPASNDAALRLLALGEQKERVVLVGCPRIDLVKEVLDKFDGDRGSVIGRLNQLGVGAQINASKPFILVSFHPVTTEVDNVEKQFSALIDAVLSLDVQVVYLWPNADAGTDKISKKIRVLRELGSATKIRFIKNLTPDLYTLALKTCSCLVGNSSSGIREGEYIGVPVVNIGTRQKNREIGANVITTPADRDTIISAVRRQLEHGSFKSTHLYGSGDAGTKIAEFITRTELNIHKEMSY